MQRHYPLNPATGLEDAAMLPWTNGNPSTGTEGSYPPFGLFTDPQDEILNALGASGITPSSDKTQLSQALARGLYLGTFSGNANALTATIPGSITFPTFLPGLHFLGVPAFTNTGSVSITISGLTPTPTATQLLRRDGSALQAGDIALGVPFRFYIDPAGNFRLANLAQSEVPRVVNNPIFYVRTDGSDSNDGSANDASHAFLTIAAAASKGVRTLFNAGSGFKIKLGVAGNYDPPGVINTGGGSITIEGDAANQDTYLIRGAGPAGGNSALVGALGGTVSLNGVNVQNTGTTNHFAAASSGGQIFLNNTSFSSTVAGNFACVFAGGGGSVTIGAGCKMVGYAGYMMLASGGTIGLGASVTVSGTPTYSIATIAAQANGNVTLGYAFSGAATGTRYTATLNGTINTFGGGANFIPGNSAGSTSSGGQYA